MNTSVKHKRPIEIKDRHSGRVLFETEAETLKDVVEEAVISGVNLSCADLRNADLGGAYLAGAQFSNADFSGANLFGIILDRATLIGTRFCNVDLRYADIRSANLKKAVLQNSDLTCAQFLASDLTRADFRNSDLHGAELNGANIISTFFDTRPTAPEEGSFLGWKTVFDVQGNPFIAKLLIPEGAKRMTPLFGRLCRAEFVKVLELSCDVSFAKCKFIPDRIYYVGGIVRDVSYYDNVQVGWSIYGINFYLAREDVRQGIWSQPLGSVAEYWESATYKGWIDGSKTLNQLDNQEDKWRSGVLLDISTAKLMNQWDEEEKSQERPHPQTSLARCTPINPIRTLGFYLNDAGHAVVPANSDYPSTIKNHSQEYALSWEKGRVLQEFQMVYISKGKGIFQSTQGGLIPVSYTHLTLPTNREV